MHGQINFTSPGQILDVAVSAVFRTTRDGPRAFLADFGFRLLVSGSGVHALGLGRLCYDSLQGGGRDELGFSLIPFCQDFWGGCAAQDAGVDEACEAHAGDMA